MFGEEFEAPLNIANFRYTKILLLVIPIPFKYLVKKRHRPARTEIFLTEPSEIEDWDHDAKNRDLDSIADIFFNCIKRTGSESLGIKEALEVYKERGKLLE
jgi:hypothetical protein